VKVLRILLLISAGFILVSFLKESEWVKNMFPDVEYKFLWEVEGDKGRIDIIEK
tara:strand:+ start:385 stop:546 length:162 start_codon:yes stop_codon:yes gene_type:complete